MKKVLIRASGIIPPKSSNGYINGIGRSNVELIKALLQHKDPEIKFAIYCTSLRSLTFDAYGWDVEYHAFPFPHKWADMKTSFEPWYRKHIIGYDLFCLTDNLDTVGDNENYVLTIHDTWNYTSTNVDKERFERAVRLAKGIVTCSHYTKQDVVNLFHVPEDKITVIHWGVEHNLFYPRGSQYIDEIKSKHNIKGPYFFCCSCSAPRKNAKYALAAFREFLKERPDFHLVMLWSNVPQELLEEYRTEIENGNVLFLKHVSDDELATLYTGANATVYVSSFEGFGFPILESMACGTPVITCKNSSLPEIGQEYACYTREKDPRSIYEAYRLYQNFPSDKEKKTLISYAKSFSWSKTAEEYMKFYKKYI